MRSVRVGVEREREFVLQRGPSIDKSVRVGVARERERVEGVLGNNVLDLVAEGGEVFVSLRARLSGGSQRDVCVI